MRVLDAAAVSTLRMGTSFVVLALVVLPVLGGYPFLVSALVRARSWVAAAAVLGSSAYVLFFLAINGLGPGRAMPVNLTYVLWSALFGASSCMLGRAGASCSGPRWASSGRR